MPTTSDARVLRVDRLGPVAARILGSTAACSSETYRTLLPQPGAVSAGATPRLSATEAQVAAVFERSVYVDVAGSLLCLGTPSIGNGPINVVMRSEERTTWIAATRVGQSIEIRDGRLVAGTWMLDAQDADCWHPPPWPKAASPEAITDTLRALPNITAHMLPSEGLAPLMFGHINADTPFARVAAPRVERLRRWLLARGGPGAPAPSSSRDIGASGSGTAATGYPTAALPCTPCSASASEALIPVDLLGLGPGLTPSGDDALYGVLLALEALGHPDSRDHLAAAVLAEAPQATTALSAQFLRCAAEGIGSEALHDFIAALISADLEALPDAVADLDRIGHTSGWDALAGAVLTVRTLSVATRDRPTRSP